MNIAEIAIKCNDKSRADLGLNKSVDWCAEFVSKVITDSDIHPDAKTVTSISCNDMINAMRKSQYWYEPDDAPKVGDIVFFDWNGADDDLASTKPLDHVGVIIGIDVNNPNRIITIEGNTEGIGQECKVRQKTRLCTWNAEYPDYYMRYTEGVVTEPTTPTTPDYKTTSDKLQLLIADLRRIADELEKINK